MGKKLAIKGHSTRSKEIIELLEMMGGENKFEDISFIAPYIFLYIDDGYFTEICWDYIGDDNKYEEFVMYTLDEFEEKYPYKVGDQVIAYAEGVLASFSIKGMRWNNKLNKVEYKICSSWYDVSMLSAIQPYTDYDIKTNKEEDKDTIEHTTEINLNHPCFDGHNKIELIIPENWKFEQRGNKMFGIRKYPQYPQYPKTYVECCEYLSLGEDSKLYTKGYKASLIQDFQKLLICRNAYWKIAGEQMGLGKPWEPDLENEELYCIQNYNKQIIKSKTNTAFNKILIFPTAEMRDEFYKNFKDLVERCKELL